MSYHYLKRCSLIYYLYKNSTNLNKNSILLFCFRDYNENKTFSLSCVILRKKTQFLFIVDNCYTSLNKKKRIFIKDFSSKCDQIRRPVNLVTFTEEILNGKLYFLCSEFSLKFKLKSLLVLNLATFLLP